MYKDPPGWVNEDAVHGAEQSPRANIVVRAVGLAVLIMFMHSASMHGGVFGEEVNSTENPAMCASASCEKEIQKLAEDTAPYMNCGVYMDKPRNASTEAERVEHCKEMFKEVLFEMKKLKTLYENVTGVHDKTDSIIMGTDMIVTPRHVRLFIKNLESSLHEKRDSDSHARDKRGAIALWADSYDDFRRDELADATQLGYTFSRKNVEMSDADWENALSVLNSAIYDIQNKTDVRLKLLEISPDYPSFPAVPGPSTNISASIHIHMTESTNHTAGKDSTRASLGPLFNGDTGLLEIDNHYGAFLLLLQG